MRLRDLWCEQDGPAQPIDEGVWTRQRDRAEMRSIKKSLRALRKSHAMQTRLHGGAARERWTAYQKN